MEVIEQISVMRTKLQQLRTSKGRDVKVGFVPTMGYLHEGHISLLRRAKEECDIVVLSIYVNPLQFGPTEDLATYPRDLQRDLMIAEQWKVDIVFTPSNEEMYPRPIKTAVSVAGLSNVLCGTSRPGHFDGVATVVLKLFHIVQPDRVYFGMKDAQQIAVIEQMVFDLNNAIDVVACETLRESDGLALSSRNVYLSAEERKQAVVLYDALQRAEQRIKEQEDLTIDQLLLQIEEHIDSVSLASIDYINILAYPSLESFNGDDQITTISQQSDLIIALAVKFGTTRLIDNRIIRRRSNV